MPAIRDILAPGGSVWLKADYTWRWEGRVIPAISFGRKVTADAAAERIKAGDLVISVRITDPVKSEGKPGLMEGVLRIVPGDRRPTEAYLPKAVVDAVAKRHGRYWPFAVGASHAWRIPSEPNARNLVPTSRLGFRLYSGERAVAPVLPGEMDAVLALQVEPEKADVDPSVAAMLAANKRRRTLASRAGADVLAERLRAGVVNLSASERGKYSTTGRSGDVQDAAAALEVQVDCCALCSAALGFGMLAPVAILRADGGLDTVHAACRAAEVHAPGTIFEEGERKAGLKQVSVRQPERNSKVPLIALGANLRRNNRLVCEICDHDWLDHPGVTSDFVGRLFEVHHLIGVATGTQATDPLTDVVVVCALCHKLAHMKG